MNRVQWTFSLCAALVALVAPLMCGYALLRSRRHQADSESEAGEGLLRRYAALPFHFGFLSGSAILMIGAGALASGDRFYSPISLLCIMIAVPLCAVVVAFPGMMIKEGSSARGGGILSIAVQIVASVAAILVGIKFSVVGVGSERAVDLGHWSSFATIAWMLLAMNIVRLLDGIDGAANILLLVAAAAIFYVTLGTTEFFLNAYSLTVAAAAAGSLRFNAFPARLPLRGSMSRSLGFVFAVLTVLSRQKTVAALLLIFPLFVVVVLIGGVMLGFLERTVFAGGKDDNS